VPQNRPFLASRNRPFLATFGSAFLESGSSSSQARPRLLQNLKTYLIIRISKGQAANGKPETNGGDYEGWLCARLQKRTKRGAPD
jgi:hypothetical protein